MTNRIPTRTTAILLVASFTAACGAPYGTKRYDPLPGTNGRWIYDGKVPPRCDRNKIRPRHYEGDGHTTGHEHIGHGHKWGMRGFKGYSSKPPCYVRRTFARAETSSDLETAITRTPPSRDPS